jgi:hypothetical protein
MSGVSQSATGTQSAINGQITSITVSPPDSASTSVKFTYDASRTLSGVTIDTPQFNTAFDRNAGHTVDCAGSICRLENPSADGAVINPAAMGWNYQTFGIWGNETPTTFLAAAGSAGSATPANAVPTIGSAIFTGLAMGFYVDTAGSVFGTAADMRADVNFASRSIAFSTANTMTGQSSVTAAAPGLNLSGNLTYAAGSSQFTGAVTTANSQLNGTSTGRFYGPNAEEIGGVYSVTGSGVSRMVGGFGGKR